MAELYTPGGTATYEFGDVQYLRVTTTSGEYDPGITQEIDRAIRHMPQVVKYVNDKARLLRAHVGANFDIIVGGGPSRPRVYVIPINSMGIHDEIKDAVLLKAALSMAGK